MAGLRIKTIQIVFFFGRFYVTPLYADELGLKWPFPSFYQRTDVNRSDECDEIHFIMSRL